MHKSRLLLVSLTFALLLALVLPVAVLADCPPGTPCPPPVEGTWAVTYTWRDTDPPITGRYTMKVDMIHRYLGKISTSDGDCGYILAAGPMMMWTIGWRPWDFLYMGIRSNSAADGIMTSSSGRRGEWKAEKIRLQPVDSITLPSR